MVGTSCKDRCLYFQCNESTKEKYWAEARNALLVVVTPIAAVTSQAGVDPPGGVWQETKNDTVTNYTHVAGTAVSAYESSSSAYNVFLASNALAFCAAFEVRVAAVSMIITYGSAIFAVTPEDKPVTDIGTTKFRLLLIVAAAPLVMRCLIQLYVKLINREPEPPCLIQAFVKPKNKTTQSQKNKSLHVQT